MKIFTLVTFILILILPIQILPQTDKKFELIKEKLLQEKVKSKSKPLEQLKQRYEQIKQRLQIDNFSNSETRKIINGKKFYNGFHLIEELWQEWNGSYWVNSFKYTYTFNRDIDFYDLKHDLNNYKLLSLSTHCHLLSKDGWII